MNNHTFHDELNGALEEAPLLCILGFRFREDAVDCKVQVMNRDYLYLDSRAIQELCRRFPTIVEHACCTHGPCRFGDVIAQATTPHLMEHIAIDILVAQSAREGGLRTVYAGNTCWIDKKRLIAKVSIKARGGDRARGADRARGVGDALGIDKALGGDSARWVGEARGVGDARWVGDARKVNSARGVGEARGAGESCGVGKALGGDRARGADSVCRINAVHETELLKVQNALKQASEILLMLFEG